MGRRRPCTRSSTPLRTRPCSRPEHGRVRAVYTCTQSVYTAASLKSCTRPVHGRVHGCEHGPCTRVHDHAHSLYTAVCGPCTFVHAAYTHPCTRPCTWLCTGCVHVTRPCTWPGDRLRGRAMYTAIYTCIHTWPCTRAVYIHVRVHDRVRTRPITGSCIRPCSRPVHGLLTAVYMARKRSCTRPVHGHGHGLCTQPCTRPCRRPCTSPCTRRCNGGVHGRPCTPPVHDREHGLYTAVYTHIRPVYETYRICNFLTNSCDYIRKQSQADYCLSPDVH